MGRVQYLSGTATVLFKGCVVEQTTNRSPRSNFAMNRVGYFFRLATRACARQAHSQRRRPCTHQRYDFYYVRDRAVDGDRLSFSCRKKMPLFCHHRPPPQPPLSVWFVFHPASRRKMPAIFTVYHNTYEQFTPTLTSLPHMYHFDVLFAVFPTISLIFGRPRSRPTKCRRRGSSTS